MKTSQLIFSSLFIYAYALSAMQQYKHHHHHTPSMLPSEMGPREIIVIEMPAQQAEADSPHAREVTYNRKKKLAIIGMVTAALVGGTAVIVFLAK